MIKLNFIDKNESRNARPFVTTGEMSSVPEVNHWFWFLTVEAHEAATTLRKYAYILCDYYRYCEAVAVKPTDATSADLQHYFADMLGERDVQPSTVNGRVLVIEHFYKFLLNRGYICSLPFATSIQRYSPGILRGTVYREIEVSTLRVRPNYSPRRYLERSAIDNFVNSLPNYRDKIIAFLIWATGLRISEIISLTLDPPHLPVDRAGYIRAEKAFDAEILGKGAKTRLVEIPSAILRDIEHYISSDRPASDSNFLFLHLHSRKGKPLTPGAIQAAFRRHSKITQIRITPHKLRDAFAMERLIFWEHVFAEKDQTKTSVEGRKIETDAKWTEPRYRALKQVSIEMGHQSVATTEIYLKHLDTYRAKAHNFHKLWMQQILNGGANEPG